MATIDKFEGVRPIPVEFMQHGASHDGVEGAEAFIECQRMTAVAGQQESMCKGFIIGAASDAANTATLRLRARNTNVIVTMRFALGIPINLGLRRIYSGAGVCTAREVFLLY